MHIFQSAARICEQEGGGGRKFKLWKEAWGGALDIFHTAQFQDPKWTTSYTLYELFYAFWLAPKSLMTNIRTFQRMIPFKSLAYLRNARTFRGEGACQKTFLELFGCSVQRG